MKTIVVYTSQTGFTERYARWIAEAADADCVPLKDAKKMNLGRYDAIVFGGWAFVGWIRGIKWFKRHLIDWQDKRLAAFCVGGSPAESPGIDIAIDRNFTAREREQIAVFYCPGGFNYDRMSRGSRFLMGMRQKMLESKKNKTEAEEEMIRMTSSSYDISDRCYIEPILAYLWPG